MRHVVDLDVVRVAVATVPVVGHEHVGVLLVEHLDQPARGLVEVGAVEGLLVGVLLPPVHAGVLVAEPDDALHARDASGGLRLAATELGHRHAFGQVVGRRAVLAAGAVDHDDPVALA